MTRICTADVQGLYTSTTGATKTNNRSFPRFLPVTRNHQSMKRILLLLTTLLLAPASALHAADASKPTAKPNIVFILAAG